jgi:hypothetical protein
MALNRIKRAYERQRCTCGFLVLERTRKEVKGQAATNKQGKCLPNRSGLSVIANEKAKMEMQRAKVGENEGSM